MRSPRSALAFAALAAAISDTTVRADPVADFYKATQMEIVVGSAVGGGYDAYARFLARHIGRHIPGNPNVIVKNMPGAGGMIAGNYVYNQAPRDGSVISHLQNTLTIDQISNTPNLKLDMRRFTWLGSMNTQSTICAFGQHVSFASAKEFMEKEYIVGASQGGTSTAAIPDMLNSLVGTRFRIVLGYPGTSTIMLGIERKEVDGVCGWGWDSAQVQASGPIESGKLKVGLDIGILPHPDLKRRNVPFVMDMMQEGLNKRVLNVLLSVQHYGRPFGGPPGIPPDRLAALRKAFADTVKDPQFLADAAKAKLEMNYLPPSEIERTIAAAFDAPADVRERAIEVMKRSTGNK